MEQKICIDRKDDDHLLRDIIRKNRYASKQAAIITDTPDSIKIKREKNKNLKHQRVLTPQEAKEENEQIEQELNELKQMWWSE